MATKDGLPANDLELKSKLINELCSIAPGVVPGVVEDAWTKEAWCVSTGWFYYEVGRTTWTMTIQTSDTEQTPFPYPAPNSKYGGPYSILVLNRCVDAASSFGFGIVIGAATDDTLSEDARKEIHEKYLGHVYVDEGCICGEIVVPENDTVNLSISVARDLDELVEIMRLATELFGREFSVVYDGRQKGVKKLVLTLNQGVDHRNPGVLNRYREAYLDLVEWKYQLLGEEPLKLIEFLRDHYKRCISVHEICRVDPEELKKRVAEDQERRRKQQEQTANVDANAADHIRILLEHQQRAVHDLAEKYVKDELFPSLEELDTDDVMLRLVTFVQDNDGRFMCLMKADLQHMVYPHARSCASKWVECLLAWYRNNVDTLVDELFSFVSAGLDSGMHGDHAELLSRSKRLKIVQARLNKESLTENLTVVRDMAAQLPTTIEYVYNKDETAIEARSRAVVVVN
ncbi:hypothetical protein AB5N19_03658 [Seiridium cardinale]